LGRLGGRYPNELSGGEQQRVALARALVAGAGLVLFDEPLSNLDADMREQLRLVISTLARDSATTSVYITHDQAEAFALADRVGVLREGRVVQFGTPEELYWQPANPFVARFTGICGEAIALARGGLGPEPGLVEVRLPEVAGATVVATLPRPVPPGVALRMFVRPPAVQMVGTEGAQLVARVRDVAFVGRGYEHALEAGGLLFTRVFSPERHARATTVGLRLAPEGCLLLPVEEAATEPGSADVMGRAGSAQPSTLVRQ